MASGYGGAGGPAEGDVVVPKEDARFPFDVLVAIDFGTHGTGKEGGTADSP